MNASRMLRTSLGALLLGLLATTAACSADAPSGGEATPGDEDDLTSITARSRTLEFVGTVYVEPGSNDQAILSQVRSQSQTAFGALRTTNIAVNSRELKEVDTHTFIKRSVKVVDPAAPATPREMLEVKYTYKDNAVVDVKYASRTSVPLAIMNPSYRSQVERILAECTANDSEAHEFSSSIWYVFEPRVDATLNGGDVVLQARVAGHQAAGDEPVFRNFLEERFKRTLVLVAVLLELGKRDVLAKAGHDQVQHDADWQGECDADEQQTAANVETVQEILHGLSAFRKCPHRRAKVCLPSSTPGVLAWSRRPLGRNRIVRQRLERPSRTRSRRA